MRNTIKTYIEDRYAIQIFTSIHFWPVKERGIERRNIIPQFCEFAMNDDKSTVVSSKNVLLEMQFKPEKI